jgi:phytoene synthase
MGVDAATRAALVEHARLSIKRGSQSFSAAARLFDKETRERAWLLYAWCRRADDIADNQDMGGVLGDQSDLGQRLALIRRLTALAFEGKPTGDPAFDALGVVAAEVGLTPQMAEDVIEGFQLDAEDWRPRTEADMLRYCYHVAGAVGVMMAVVMGVDPKDQETLDRANDLGLAFQVTDDILDVEADPQDTGKDQGKDIAANKSTFVSTLGKENARARAEMLVEQAKRHLHIFGERADMMREVADYVLSRRA